MLAEAPTVATVAAGSAHISNPAGSAQISNLIPNGQDNFFVGPEHHRYNSH